MSDLLIKMAQAAVQDKTLFAPYIQQYASQKSLSWEEVADSLQIGRDQLAKLALCGRPQPAMYKGGILQVADYVGMDRALLNAFMAEVEGDRRIQVTEPLKKATKVGKSSPKRNFVAFLPKKLGWAAAAVLFIFVMVGTFVSAQTNEAAAATLVVNQGQATIVYADSGNASQTVLVPGGEALVVSTSDRIFLAAESTARIHLVDGSTIDLEPGTEINVNELVIEDGTYRVHLQLLAGRTLSRVKTVLGVGDRFEISTPSSTASVRGTVFTVAYISADETYISCDEGQVEVSLVGQESQMLEAGMEVTAVVGRPLEVKSQHSPEPVEKPQETTSVEPETIPVEMLPIENGPDGIGPPQPVWDNIPEAPPVVSDSPPVVTNPPADEDNNENTGSSPPPDNPPEEVGDPPDDGNGNGGNGDPPDSVPGNPPDDPPGEGNPPNGNGNGNGGNGGLPDSVPGNPPDDPPGEGNPPNSGSGPPGQGNNK